MAIAPRERPVAVTVSGWLVFLVMMLNIFQGQMLIKAAARPNRVGGTLASYSDRYWIFNAGLDLLFAMIIAVLWRRLLDGELIAKWTVLVLAVIDSVFAVFLLPYGLPAIALNGGVLVLLSTRESRRYFGQ